MDKDIKRPLDFTVIARAIILWNGSDEIFVSAKYFFYAAEH
jgi:hypothetical protein